jgi:hypothetical protein
MAAGDERRAVVEFGRWSSSGGGRVRAVVEFGRWSSSGGGRVRAVVEFGRLHELGWRGSSLCAPLRVAQPSRGPDTLGGVYADTHTPRPDPRAARQQHTGHRTPVDMAGRDRRCDVWQWQLYPRRSHVLPVPANQRLHHSTTHSAAFIRWLPGRWIQRRRAFSPYIIRERALYSQCPPQAHGASLIVLSVLSPSS